VTRRRGGDPVPLRDALAGVGRDLGMPDPDRLTTLLDAWPQVVGETLAPHAHVRSLRDGVLLVAVDAPAVATQVKYLESHVRDAATRLVGAGVVRQLRVVVHTPRTRP
jgi:predicted nucleic acid-binding Zn ribbon protein